MASEDLNAKFSAYPEIYSGELLSRMSQRVKDDIGSVAAQARGLFSEDEGEAQHSMRHFAWRFLFVLGFRELVRIQINILLDSKGMKTYVTRTFS